MTRNSSVTLHASSDMAIEVMGVSAGWNDINENSPITLKNISVRIKPGKLCAIIGPVGSGKVCY